MLENMAAGLCPGRREGGLFLAFARATERTENGFFDRISWRRRRRSAAPRRQSHHAAAARHRVSLRNDVRKCHWLVGDGATGRIFRVQERRERAKLAAL